MFRMLVLSIAIALLPGTSAVAEDLSGTILVQGEGIVSAAPDVFFLDVAVTLNDLDLEKIQGQVRDRCGRIVKSAQGFKLDQARTFTRDYKIAPQYDNTSRLIGYYVTQSFRFALSDLNQAEALTTAVLKAGATTIESIEFTVADSAELWEESREAAVEHALKRATRMTKVVGSKPGLPKMITDQGNQLTFSGCVWDGAAQQGVAAGGAPLPEGDRVFFVPPTAVKFQVFVQVQFGILPL
jgi:uncharacterized protein YggE